nr:beta-eliminating lyase-related protein [Singulisphaera sp. GP187]
MFHSVDPDTGETIHPPMELVRLAIPRRVYTQSHIDYTVEATIELFQQRDSIRGLRIVEAPPTLRHFTAKFAELL